MLGGATYFSTYFSDDSEQGFDHTPRSAYSEGTGDAQERLARQQLCARGAGGGREDAVAGSLQAGLARRGGARSQSLSASPARLRREEEDKLERDRLQEAIEELEAENEALKSRGHAEAKAESRRKREAFETAQQALQQEVQQVRQMYQEARHEADQRAREFERLRGQVGEQMRLSAEQAAQLAEQAAELEESRASRRELAEFRSLRQHLLQNVQEDPGVAAAVEPQGHKLADLRTSIEPPIFRSLEKVELGWQAFKRLL